MSRCDMQLGAWDVRYAKLPPPDSASRGQCTRADWRSRRNPNAAAAAPPPTSSTTDLTLKKVRIHGLQSKPEFNGSRGQALSFDADKGRYEVMIRGTSKTMFIKASNLSIVEDAIEEPQEQYIAAAPPRVHSNDDIANYSCVSVLRMCMYQDKVVLRP